MEPDDIMPAYEALGFSLLDSDGQVNMDSVALLRLYVGRAPVALVLDEGFYKWDFFDHSSPDNGATIIVDILGRRWHLKPLPGSTNSLSTSVSTALSTTNSRVTSLSTSTSTGLSTSVSGLSSLSTSTSTGLSTGTSGLASLSTSTSTGLSTASSGLGSLSTALSLSTGTNRLGFKRPETPTSNDVRLYDWLRSTDIRDVEFGCVGDGVVDDTAALNALTLAGLTTGRRVVGRAGANYKITGVVNINCNADFSNCTFTAPTSLVGPAVKTSGAVAGAQLIFLSINYPTVRNGRASGVVPTAGSIGIQIESARDCKFQFYTINGFEENLQLYSNDGTTGFVSYNNLYFNEIVFGSAINVHLKTELTGWVNQCTWFGGQFAQISGDTAAFNTTNIQITKGNVGGNNPPNGHTFVGCSLEGAFTRTIKYTLAAGSSYFSCNTWVNCRFEAAANMEFASSALYDMFVNCLGAQGATYVGGVYPNVLGGTRMFKYTVDIAAIPGVAGFRTASNSPLFQASNSGGAAALSFGIGNQINAAVTAGGSMVTFHPTDPARLFATTAVNTGGGIPKIEMGDGTIASTNFLGFFANADWRHNFTLTPFADVTYNLGSAARRYTDIFSSNFRPGAGTVLWTSGSGTPETSLTAVIGSLRARTDGRSGTSMYLKETGAGNTGWLPLATVKIVSADHGDSNFNIVVTQGVAVDRWATPLTVDRAATLDTTGATNGDSRRILRTASATGAFNLNVGTGPLKALAPGQWCDVAYDGTAWILTGFGSL